MRDELLNESLFLDLDQARQMIAAWVADYNTARPHSSLGYKTPAAYADHLTATGHRAALPRRLRALSGCSHRAKGRINSRGSNRRWMKVQWQVKCKGESDVAKSGLDLFFDQGFQRLVVEIRGVLTMVEAAHCISTISARSSATI